MVLGLDVWPPTYKVGLLPTCDIHLSTDILRFKFDLNPIFHGKKWITLNSFIASAWIASEDSVVSGDAMLSLLCSRCGCLHRTQSAKIINYELIHFMFTGLWKMTICSIMSICSSVSPTAWNKSATTEWIFVKSDNEYFFVKPVDQA